MSQRRRFGLLCAAATALALAFPVAGGAAVTLGEDTTIGSGDAYGCSGCTFANLQHPTRPLTAPFDGVFVRWRVRTIGPPSPMSLQVLRPLPGGLFTGAGTSAPATVVSGGERVFASSLPARQGDLIALNLPSSPVAVEQRVPLAMASFGEWSPALADGESPGRAPTISPNAAFIFNADIEPDCDHDGLGDESQDADKLSCDPPPCLGKAPTIVGTLGNDVISGTPGDDVILASNGDDRVLAGGGRDIVCGGKHKDRLFGGAGRDRLLGELGRDVLLGEGGRDVLKGLGGRDKCKGGPGRDRGSSCERARSVERNRRGP